MTDPLIEDLLRVAIAEPARMPPKSSRQACSQEKANQGNQGKA